MRTLILLIIVVAGAFLSACSDVVEETYKVNSPVYLSYDELRISLKVGEAQDIVQPGKIYFKGDYIFVNEYQKGIHVVNNTDPMNPSVEKFIEIPGNVDMAVKGDMLYADSYVDLVTLDVSDLDNIVEVDRDTNVFPYIVPQIEEGRIDAIDETQGVIVGYEVSEKTVEIEETHDFWTFERYSVETAMDGAKISNGAGGGDVGIGGSMARFTLYDDYLYIVDQASLHLFDVSNNANPDFAKNFPISWNIETIFPYNQMLFIGSQTGMYIYSLQNPAQPAFISEFRHATACDPVVVEGNYAYVTLRGGNLCGAIESQLDVIDISNIESPQFVKSYPMEEPYGLGIKNDVLFVCDGNAGLKIYDATDVTKIDSNKLAGYTDINAFDVIPLPNLLIMIGADGLYQYDYSDLNNIQLLSYIPIYENSK